MKLNKKGSTLVELIISIVLISIILVFLVKLLVDINDSESNNSYAKKNQVIRAEIIRVIENDINEKIIEKVEDESSNIDNLKIKITFIDDTSSLIIVEKESENKTTLTYRYNNKDGVEKVRKWVMNDECYIYTTKADVKIVKDEPKKDSDLELYSMIIDIEIHTINDDNTVNKNNPLDDILISYIGNVIDLKTEELPNCFGKGC